MTTTTTQKLEHKTLASGLANPHLDFKVLWGATLLLLGGGVTMVASASSVFAYETYGNSWYLAARQVVFAALGVFAMWFASHRSPYATRKIAWVFLAGVILALIAVLIIGTSVNGQRNWIEFGPIRIQPSEYAKLAVILWSADVLTRKQALLSDRKHLLVPIVPVCVVILLLILREGDLGTAMVMTPIMMAMMFYAGVPGRWMGYTSVLGLAGIAYYSHAQAYRMVRFTAWLHPDADPSGAGFQLAHGKQAMGTGGWWGLSLGASREKWGTLPEAHTDFIYAVVGEETGLLGTFAILILFLAIGYTGFRIARRAPDPYTQLVAAGVTTWITVQMFVNICAVLGLLPITGVPLPLVSYGGSSLIPTLTALGILMSFARHSAAEADSS